MNSGIKKILVSLSLAVTMVPASAEEMGLSDLMERLGEVDSVEKTYEETKHVDMLEEPLVRTGVIDYRRPDYLRKESDGEPRELVELVGEQLRVVSPRGEREMRVDEDPRVRGVIASIRATLAGDAGTLKEHFRVELSGEVADWRLHLSPRTDAMEEVIDSITIEGEEAAIREFLVHEANGDRSRMVIPAP